MPNFYYQGRDTQGQQVSGYLEASSEQALSELLMQKSIIPIRIEKKDKGKKFNLDWLQTQQVSLPAMIVFTRQMYSLTKAGIPILRAIHGLSGSTSSKKLSKALEQVVQQLGSGRALSTAFSEHPKIFNQLFVAIIHVGENTGRLEDAFLQLSIYLEKEQETRKRIKAAVRYPSFVLIALAAALVILNIFVIPKFAQIFEKFNAELPLATRILINTSNLFVNYWAYMLLIAIFSTIGSLYYLHTAKGKLWWDKVKLKMPIMGSIIERSVLARFSQTFAMMLSSGIPLNQSLSLVANAVDNAFMATRILNMRHGIEKGESLLQTANNSRLFSPLVMQMIAVGEETGQVDDLLREAADFYEREVDYDLKNLTAKIEPILIVFVALMVLVLALGIFTPMWDMMKVVKG